MKKLFLGLFLTVAFCSVLAANNVVNKLIDFEAMEVQQKEDWMNLMHEEHGKKLKLAQQNEKKCLDLHKKYLKQFGDLKNCNAQEQEALLNQKLQDKIKLYKEHVVECRKLFKECEDNIKKLAKKHHDDFVAKFQDNKGYAADDTMNYGDNVTAKRGAYGAYNEKPGFFESFKKNVLGMEEPSEQYDKYNDTGY